MSGSASSESVVKSLSKSLPSSLEDYDVLDFTEHPLNLEKLKRRLLKVIDSRVRVIGLIESCIKVRSFEGYRLSFDCLKPPQVSSSDVGKTVQAASFYRLMSGLLDLILAMEDCREKPFFIKDIMSRTLGIDSSGKLIRRDPIFLTAEMLGLPPALFLTYLGYFDELKALHIKTPAALSERDKYGNGIYHYLVFGWENAKEYRGIEKFVSSLNNELHQHNLKKYSPAYAAMARGDEDLLQIMARAHGGSLYSPELMYAAALYTGHSYALFQLFLPKGGSLECINTPNFRAESVMHVLVQQNFYETAATLLGQDRCFEINLTLRDQNGKTAIQILLESSAGEDREDARFLMALMRGHQRTAAQHVKVTPPSPSPILDASEMKALQNRLKEIEVIKELEDGRAQALQNFLQAQKDRSEALQGLLCAEEEIKELKKQNQELIKASKSQSKSKSKTSDGSHAQAQAQEKLRQDYEAQLAALKLKNQNLDKLDKAQKDQIKSLQKTVAELSVRPRQVTQATQTTIQKSLPVAEAVRASMRSIGVQTLPAEPVVLATPIISVVSPLEQVEQVERQPNMSDLFREIKSIQIGLTEFGARLDSGLSSGFGALSVDTASRAEGVASLKTMVAGITTQTEKLTAQNEGLTEEIAALRIKLAVVTEMTGDTARGRGLTATAFAPAPMMPPSSAGYPMGYYPPVYYPPAYNH